MKLANEFKELFEKADAPWDIRVDEDYLDYGHDAITRPSTATGLHRVYLTKATAIDCTVDFARFVCFVCNNATEIQKALELYEGNKLHDTP
jgi:hypothetical protein